MKILLLMKTVPDTTNARIDPETNNLIRDGIKTVINPTDLCGLKFALNISEQVEEDVEIDVLTMGPPSAEKYLRECIQMGAEEAYLLAGLEFKGSDTIATSYALAEAAKSIGDYDIIFTGDQTMDGDTGQVGPQVAERLGMNQVTYVSDINYVDGEFEVKRNIGTGVETVKLSTPFVATALKGSVNKPSKFALKRSKIAKEKEIHDLTPSSLGLDLEKLGQKGSLTIVKDLSAPRKSEAGNLIDKGSAKENIEEVIKILEDKKVLV